MRALSALTCALALAASSVLAGCGGGPAKVEAAATTHTLPPANPAAVGKMVQGVARRRTRGAWSVVTCLQANADGRARTRASAGPESVCTTTRSPSARGGAAWHASAVLIHPPGMALTATTAPESPALIGPYIYGRQRRRR